MGMLGLLILTFNRCVIPIDFKSPAASVSLPSDR
jgi:hypothetical protein